MTVRITKEFTFEAAHQLEGYAGQCRHIHGHSYRLLVTLQGTPCTDEASPAYGMVMDFSLLKQLVNRLVIERLDHALILRDGTPLSEELQGLPYNVARVPYQPTCENMIAHIAETLRQHLPPDVQLFCLRLYETATSYAEWFANDNA